MFNYRFKEDDCLGGEYGLYGDYIHGQGTVGEDYEDEQWAPIEESDGYYVSTNGRVWSSLTNRFLKPKPLDNHGHLGVCLSNKGRKPAYRYIHRLMATEFLDNPSGLPVVRHLDDNPSNNYIKNLAWGTQKDNHDDSVLNGTVYHPGFEEMRERNRKLMTPVVAINIKTGERKWFDSQCEASRALNVAQANIFKVLKGERTHAGGYHFERSDADGSGNY